MPGSLATVQLPMSPASWRRGRFLGLRPRLPTERASGLIQPVEIAHPPLGKLVDVGGHRLHIYRTGKGGPTVVFESGGASWSLDWHLIQTEVEKFTSACSYDRAGFGWSDSGPNPRTSARIVAELHILLTKAEIKKPYVLVGHSFGGHTVRLFASNYPDEVAGVILIDARHEAINSMMPPAWQRLETAGKAVQRLMLLASRVGALNLLGRLMGAKAAPPMAMRLPPELRPVYLAVGFQPKYFQSNLDELAASAESDKQLSAAGTLGNIPLTVIRHGIPDLFSRMPAAQATRCEQVWQELQADLAKRSSDSRMVFAATSGHGIPIDQPGLVVDAIRQMVETARGVSVERNG
jgi:pimeloyl-ACP methyl ester carboxylesterase